MSAPPPIVFFGSSGNALTLRDLMRRTSDLVPLYEVVAYIDDFRGNEGLALDGVPIVSFAHWERELRDVPVAITLGDPALRRTLTTRVEAAGGSLPAIYDRQELGTADVGAGAFVACGLQLPGVRIGAGSLLYPFVSAPPGTQLGAFVTLCPRVRLRGDVVVEDGVFVGAAASIDATAGRVRVGRDARIVAGTVLRASLGAGLRAFGEPVRTIAGMHITNGTGD